MTDWDRERWERVKSVLNEMGKLPTGERATFLDRTCASDPGLRAEVEALMAADDASYTLAEAAPAPSPVFAGDRIGNYRILASLGEGGMGVVYEAEQDEPRRRVALKVIRGGQFVDDARVRMFQREAEALARLKHPGIAAIYEAGRTEQGEHFFAMELVRGDTLDVYLRKRPTPITPDELDHRLRLFRRICDAVHYAHQRGVIHRDLKPSNVIVMELPSGSSSEDSTDASWANVPSIKILDFGVARITEGDLAGSTLVTEAGTIRGTLPYMSPEQARGDPDDIDVRVDVYALGVMLYEILTGSRPYDVHRAALPEALRVICEDQPRPLRQSWSGVRRLDGDVETIVAKTLEKEPDRRYAGAAALAEDVARYLGSQPILARPPNAAYQLRKLVARNKVVFSALAVVFAVLAGASVVSTTMYLRARTEAAKSEQAATFMTKMLGGVGPAVARGRDTTMLREILEDTAARIATDLEGQPEVEASIRRVLGNTYRELGDYALAEEHLRAALEIDRRTMGDEHEDTLWVMHNLAFVFHNQARYDEAEQFHLEVLETRRRVLGDEHPYTLSSMNDLGYLYNQQGRYDEAEPLHRETLETRTRLLGDDDPQTLWSKHNLAWVHNGQGRYEEAARLHREVLETRRRVLGNDHPDTLWSIHNLASVYQNQDRNAETERLHREALGARRRVLGDDHPHTLASLQGLATAIHRQGRHDEAESLERSLANGAVAEPE